MVSLPHQLYREQAPRSWRPIGQSMSAYGESRNSEHCAPATEKPMGVDTHGPGYGARRCGPPLTPPPLARVCAVTGSPTGPVSALGGRPAFKSFHCAVSCVLTERLA